MECRGKGSSFNMQKSEKPICCTIKMIWNIKWMRWKTKHDYYKVTLMEVTLIHIRSVDLTNEDINFDFKT